MLFRSPGLLDILKKYNVKATFFVVGEGNLSILKRINAEGHTIGLHTNTHEYSKIYANDEAFFADLQTISNKVYAQLDQIRARVGMPAVKRGGSCSSYSSFCLPPPSARPPHGSSLTQKLAWT